MTPPGAPDARAASDAAAPHPSAASSPQHVHAPISTAAAVEALRDGPRGARLISAIAVAALFIAWLAFYFLLFLPRGAIG
jgi:hypothetical protein